MSDAEFGKHRCDSRCEKQAEKSPKTTSSRGRSVHPAWQGGQVGPDFGIPAEDYWNLGECSADAFGNQRFFVDFSGFACRGRGRGFCHDSFFGEGRENRLPDRFYQVVILLLSHSGWRRRLRLCTRLSGNHAEENKEDRSHNEAATASHSHCCVA